jgi:hypothetical protein
MFRFRQAWIAVTFALVANVAAAQPVNQTSGRDSLWNGTLIGLGAGVGATAALDAVFCENGFGGCDFPWAALVTLGGIGAGAGAGIDFLIGRNKTTVRLSPLIGATRKGVLASLVLPQPGSRPAQAPQRARLPELAAPATLSRSSRLWSSSARAAFRDPD